MRRNTSNTFAMNFSEDSRPGRPRGEQRCLPFWKQLHRFLAYPLFPSSLLVLGIFTLALVVAGQYDVVDGMVGFLCGSLCLKYAFESLKSTMAGNLFPPRPGFDLLFAHVEKIFSQLFLLFVLFVGAYTVVSMTGMFQMALLYLCFVLFFYPAIIILQVIKNSMLSALNPVNFFRLIGNMGPGYLLAYLALILVPYAMFMIGEYLFASLPHLVAYGMAIFFGQYYIVFMYSLIGYLIVQYNAEIEATVAEQEIPPVGALAEAALETSREVKEIEEMVEFGRSDEALALLRAKESAGGLTDPALAGKYFSLLLRRDKMLELLEFSSVYLRRLLGAGMAAEAVQAFLVCREQDSAYLPPLDLGLDMGEALEGRGHIREAFSIYNALVEHHEHGDILAEAYFRAALILNERMAQPEKARSLLQGMHRAFPDHPILEKVNNYLRISF